MTKSFYPSYGLLLTNVLIREPAGASVALRWLRRVYQAAASGSQED